MSESRTYLSTAQAAAYLGVCTKTLRRYVSDGRLNAYRVGPRNLRYLVSELDALARPVVTVATVGGGRA